jgi:primosomal protein N'
MQANERSTEKVLVFTKQAEFPFLSQIGTYKINTIIQEELTLRSEIGYPPFGSLIKIIITTTQSHREEITERMDEYFSKQDISLVRTRPVPQSNKIQLQYILKEHTSFIEEQGSELSLFLSSLRAPFSIEENPERL